ncbi:hypothetical protein D3C77_317380 [compost metagenome]
MYIIKVDQKKFKWLKRHGLKPMTDEVIEELLRTEERAKPYTAEELKRMFQLYRRYGSLIIPYSIGYIEQMPLKRLKAAHRKNLRDFIFSRSRISNALMRNPWSFVAATIGATIGAIIPIIALR